MRLGFAVQLGTMRFLGIFLDDSVDVPAGMAGDLARQLEIADPACLALYRERRVIALKAEVVVRLSRVDLPELLLKMHA